MQKKAVRKWKKKDGVQMEKKGVRSQGKTRIGECAEQGLLNC